MQLTSPAAAALYPLFCLLASAIGVNANSLGSTAMTWQNGASAANSVPLAATVFGTSGTLALLIANLTLNGTTIQPITATQSAFLGAGSSPLVFPLGSATSASVISNSGNWGATVGTINGTAATVSVFVYGVRLS